MNDLKWVLLIDSVLVLIGICLPALPAVVSMLSDGWKKMRNRWFGTKKPKSSQEIAEVVAEFAHLTNEQKCYVAALITNAVAAEVERVAGPLREEISDLLDHVETLRAQKRAVDRATIENLARGAVAREALNRFIPFRDIVPVNRSFFTGFVTVGRTYKDSVALYTPKEIKALAEAVQFAATVATVAKVTKVTTAGQPAPSAEKGATS